MFLWFFSHANLQIYQGLILTLSKSKSSKWLAPVASLISSPNSLQLHQLQSHRPLLILEQAKGPLTQGLCPYSSLFLNSSSRCLLQSLPTVKKIIQLQMPGTWRLWNYVGGGETDAQQRKWHCLFLYKYGWESYGTFHIMSYGGEVT